MNTSKFFTSTIMMLEITLILSTAPCALAADYTVCPTGCTFSEPLAAFHQALQDPDLLKNNILIKIKDGTYHLKDQFYSETPLGLHLNIIGNQVDPSRVVLDFDNIAGTNLNGFIASREGKIGYIDGVTINGIGAQTKHTPQGTSWYNNSYGSGIIARYGSYIGIGPHVVINHFYYSVVADLGGIIDAHEGKVIGRDAGDVNFMARHNGVIICPNCTADRAADTTSPPYLGCNFTAEDGGSLTIDGSTGQHSHTGGLCILTTSHAWAHQLRLLGGLEPGQGWGIWVTDNGYAETYGSLVEHYQMGAYINQGGGVDITRDIIKDNSQDGVVADGGHISGGDTISSHNGGVGYHAFHQGNIHIYNGRKLSVDNKEGLAAVEKSGGIFPDAYLQSTVTVQ